MAGERVLFGGGGGGGSDDPMMSDVQRLGVSPCFISRRRRFTQQTIELNRNETTTQKVMMTTSDVIIVIDRTFFRSGEFPVYKKITGACGPATENALLPVSSVSS